jgi:hypothetical protein
MRPKSDRIFQIATRMYSFKECKRCTYRNGILTVTLARGDDRKTVTLKPCLVRGKPEDVLLPEKGQADCYLLCAESGDYVLYDKYVMNRRIIDRKGLVPIGTGGGNTPYDDIKRRLENSPLGDFATVRRWKT